MLSLYDDLVDRALFSIVRWAIYFFFAGFAQKLISWFTSCVLEWNGIPCKSDLSFFTMPFIMTSHFPGAADLRSESFFSFTDLAHYMFGMQFVGTYYALYWLVYRTNKFWLVRLFSCCRNRVLSNRKKRRNK